MKTMRHTRAANSLRRRPRRLLIALLTFLAAGIAVAATVAAATPPTPPIALLSDPERARTILPQHAQNLADAVERWNIESREEGPGAPLVSEATDVFSAIGPEKDTLTVFPTRRGDVCFQIHGAGTCGRVDSPTGLTLAILTTPGGGARLYGVAADHVQRVEVEVEGVAYQALLRSNGIYFALPPGSDGGDLTVTAIWNDGSAHLFPRQG
jgi:hypothetical protein